MDEKLKKDVEALWSSCFHDPEDFMCLFFGSVYDERNVRCEYSGDKLVCALQSLPYKFRFYGHDLPMGYYAGVSTFNEFRGKGHMSRLIEKSLGSCRYSLVSLLPAEDWLYDYYARFGFASVFFNGMEELSGGNPSVACCNAGYSDKLFDFMHEKELVRNCSVVHSQDDLCAIVEDNRQSGGKVVAIKSDGCFDGVAFCYPGETCNVIVKEIYCNPGVERDLVGCVCREFGVESVKVVRRCGLNRFGMMRIVDVEKILSVFSSQYPDIDFRVHVDDHIIERNNGVFYAKNGMVSSMPDGKYDYSVSILELSELIFGAKPFYGIKAEQAYMSLMLE